MGRRTDFHRLFGDIDVGQLLELVIHARQFLFDIVSRVRNFFLDPGDIEKNAAMRTPPALFDFTYDATRNVITR